MKGSGGRGVMGTQGSHPVISSMNVGGYNWPPGELGPVHFPVSAFILPRLGWRYSICNRKE